MNLRYDITVDLKGMSSNIRLKGHRHNFYKFHLVWLISVIFDEVQKNLNTRD